ncbi:MAG: hypothetical protein WAK17_05350 [Candidatus Nitrosopolaris sp.]
MRYILNEGTQSLSFQANYVAWWFTAFIIVSEVLIPYSKYVKILKYLTISLLAYVATAIIVGGNFKNLLLAIIFISWGPPSIMDKHHYFGHSGNC